MCRNSKCRENIGKCEWKKLFVAAAGEDKGRFAGLIYCALVYCVVSSLRSAIFWNLLVYVEVIVVSSLLMWTCMSCCAPFEICEWNL